MFTNAKEPKWTGADHLTVLLKVEMDGEWIDFIASPADCTDYGPMLYSFAVAGIFGEITPSDEERILAGELPPPQGYEMQNGVLVNVAQLEWDMIQEFNHRLAQYTSDESKARAEIDVDYAAERKAAIAALLAVKEQPGWPTNVVWPN